MDRYLNLKKYHKSDRVNGGYLDRKNLKSGSNLRSQSRSDLTHLCHQTNTKWNDVVYVMQFQKRKTSNWWDCKAYKQKIEGGGLVTEIYKYVKN